MSEEESVQMELTPILAAIIKNEGGEYALPFQEFVAVSSTPGLALEMDLVDDGATLLIKLGQVPQEDATE